MQRSWPQEAERTQKKSNHAVRAGEWLFGEANSAPQPHMATREEAGKRRWSLWSKAFAPSLTQDQIWPIVFTASEYVLALSLLRRTQDQLQG